MYRDREKPHPVGDLNQGSNGTRFDCADIYPLPSVCVCGGLGGCRAVFLTPDLDILLVPEVDQY